LRSVESIREDFPVLKRVRRDGKPLIYFDNAATSLKPRQVIEAVKRYYEECSANVHRAVYELSQEATDLYEEARAKIARFIGCKPEELVFVKNTTEAINLVAYGVRWSAGDEVVSTVMEHHSNMIPWQIAAERFRIRLRYAGIRPDGTLDLESLSELVGRRTRLVAVCHASNVLGTINDVRRIAEVAHENGALLLVDAAQSAPHMPISVKDLDCDLLAFSGHKLLGPTGIGCLYVREGVEEEVKPPFAGGGMISRVELHGYKLSDMPWRFEAGTPNVAGAVGLAAAVDYLTSIGMESVREHEKRLTERAIEILREIDGVEIYGPMDPERRCGLVSFNLRGVSGDLVAALLDEHENIAVRSGLHCAQPLHRILGVQSSVRASFYLYNTLDELEAFRRGLKRISGELGRRD